MTVGPASVAVEFAFHDPRETPKKPCGSPAVIWICGAALRRPCEAETGSGASALSAVEAGSEAFALAIFVPATGSLQLVLEVVAHHFIVRPRYANRWTSLSESGWVSCWTS